jgi:hypothetical protein
MTPKSPYVLRIPCVACGATVPYAETVQRTLGPGHVGYGHPVGGCLPTDIAEWSRRITLNSPQWAA